MRYRINNTLKTTTGPKDQEPTLVAEPLPWRKRKAIHSVLRRDCTAIHRGGAPATTMLGPPWPVKF